MNWILEIMITNVVSASNAAAIRFHWQVERAAAGTKRSGISCVY